MASRSSSNRFLFLDPGELRDGDLYLDLVETISAVPSMGRVPVYRFDMHRDGYPLPAGMITLRVGHNVHLDYYVGHIGYHVEPEFRGHRFAARSCTLLLPLARRHELNPLWITCNPDNLPSRRTCEILGASLVEIVPIPAGSEMYRMGERFKCRYRLEL